MKKLSILFLYSLFALATILQSCNSENTPEIAPPVDDQEEEVAPEDEFTLVFEENFDSNLSEWDIWLGGAFNDEAQFYRPEQLELTDGILRISTLREDAAGATNPFDSTPKSFEFVSGRIESKDTFGPSSAAGDQTYKIATRMQLPSGFGMWPAFWLFADPWPTLGEIDILEARGNEADRFQSNIFFGTTPGASMLSQSDTKMEFIGDVDLTADFHIYELIWNEDGLEILLDGVEVISYTSSDRNGLTQIFGNDLKIVLNNAVGGVFFPNSNPDDYVDQAEMLVDWVKVYRK